MNDNLMATEPQARARGCLAGIPFREMTQLLETLGNGLVEGPRPPPRVGWREPLPRGVDLFLAAKARRGERTPFARRRRSTSSGKGSRRRRPERPRRAV